MGIHLLFEPRQEEFLRLPRGGWQLCLLHVDLKLPLVGSKGLWNLLFRKVQTEPDPQALLGIENQQSRLAACLLPVSVQTQTKIEMLRRRYQNVSRLVLYIFNLSKTSEPAGAKSLVTARSSCAPPSARSASNARCAASSPKPHSDSC